MLIIDVSREWNELYVGTNNAGDVLVTFGTNKLILSREQAEKLVDRIPERLGRKSEVD